MTTLTVTLPLPPRACWQNHRGHWSKGSRAKRQQRDTAKLHALAALNRAEPKWQKATVLCCTGSSTWSSTPSGWNRRAPHKEPAVSNPKPVPPPEKIPAKFIRRSGELIAVDTGRIRLSIVEFPHSPVSVDGDYVPFRMCGLEVRINGEVVADGRTGVYGHRGSLRAYLRRHFTETAGGGQ